jgi:hypothetical protein
MAQENYCMGYDAALKHLEPGHELTAKLKKRVSNHSSDTMVH